MKIHSWTWCYATHHQFMPSGFSINPNAAVSALVFMSAHSWNGECIVWLMLLIKTEWGKTQESIKSSITESTRWVQMSKASVMLSVQCNDLPLAFSVLHDRNLHDLFRCPHTCSYWLGSCMVQPLGIGRSQCDPYQVLSRSGRAVWCIDITTSFVPSGTCSTQTSWMRTEFLTYP